MGNTKEQRPDSSATSTYSGSSFSASGAGAGVCTGSGTGCRSSFAERSVQRTENERHIRIYHNSDTHFYQKF
ncbi:hypothetical protein BpHYR1_053082 [Brachionus plicatilis]|uniref:Uncharacterized protein n=1 Tax=Brachionus plicatilis TaxID=10195 RepID=A0A3M7PN86_BRAPC|nr:hypothetical protein BpHYR1_053082 [Brachionus plicatilis]